MHADFWLPLSPLLGVRVWFPQSEAWRLLWFGPALHLGAFMAALRMWCVFLVTRSPLLVCVLVTFPAVASAVSRPLPGKNTSPPLWDGARCVNGIRLGQWSGTSAGMQLTSVFCAENDSSAFICRGERLRRLYSKAAQTRPHCSAWTLNQLQRLWADLLTAGCTLLKVKLQHVHRLLEDFQLLVATLSGLVWILISEHFVRIFTF